MTVLRGRNFLQTPGPTNIPHRILNAMHRPAVEFSGPAFIELSRSCLQDIKPLFRLQHGEAFIYAANGHGAWEAALMNTLSPGDRILVPQTGNFSNSWKMMAESLGLEAVEIPTDWRHAADPGAIETILRDDTAQDIKAILQVHVDTATSVISDIEAIRGAIDAAAHPALLMVDTIASLITTDFRMDDWGVDVAVGAGQKGLMLPPGLSFTAVSEKALAANKEAKLPRNYWDWGQRQQKEGYRWFCGTAPEHLIFGLREAIDMVNEETLEVSFARHARLATAVRQAVEVWGSEGAMELNALIPEQRANSVTTIRVAEDIDILAFHSFCRDKFNLSLGYAIGDLAGKAFRIGHMGDLNEPMILGALGAIEAGFVACGIPHGRNGVSAAIESLGQAVAD
jgi:alanine-glyoxylate transaminase/serine-glyoxylate transaminase/serine-pyruvate transaminase